MMMKRKKNALWLKEFCEAPPMSTTCERLREKWVASIIINRVCGKVDSNRQQQN